jgi:ribosome-interacting GTPase 1
MPTNLPPDYFAVERRFRSAESTEEKIALLEEMLGTIPKHKGTDHLRADLRRKLSRLKQATQSKKRGDRHASSYHVTPEGAGQAVLVGPTNVGKSALLRALTRAEPEVSDAPYTTWEPMPGMMAIDDIQIQLIDTPPLNPDFMEPGLFDLMRRAGVILPILDIQTDPIEQLADVVALIEEHHIAPRHREGSYPEENHVLFKPFLVLGNKCDDETWDEDVEILRGLLQEPWPLLPVSAVSGRNLHLLKKQVFQLLEIMRVYSKAPGKDPDRVAPFVLPKRSTVEYLASRIHRDFYEHLKQARVWGSTEFDGQLVGRDYVLHDRDIVELRM